MTEFVAILDFGSQYTQLIARRVRENDVFCRIYRFDADPETLKRGENAGEKLIGVILSGGPASVYDVDAPQLDPRLLELGVPVLGVCYGLQSIARLSGGHVEPGARGGEYGRAELDIVRRDHPLFEGVSPTTTVWMSHGDSVARLGDEFEILARSGPCPIAAVARKDGRVIGIQFHPEVTHSREGKRILRNFLFSICRATGDWTVSNFLERSIEQVRHTVGDSGRVVLGLSGGVDSSVAALLLNRAIGDRLDAIFVDNGLLRQNERSEVEAAFRDRFGVRLHVVDASNEFLSDLSGILDPEVKRKKIGHRFIDVFKAEAKRCQGAQFLAQGTLYPDVIESVSPRGGPSVTIKTHHNVGGLPAELGFTLVEPFRELFKDEVRALGRMLGLPENLIARHPFPGPGLAVRCLGEITREKLDVLRAADAIFRQELTASGWMEKTSQAFVVLLPVRTVGVQGDARTYGYCAALRAVTTEDFMTAEFAPLPHELLGKVASRITNEVRAINRVTYDVTSKPPGTIEWE